MNVEPDYAALVNALLNDQQVTAYEMAKRAGLTQQAVLDITKGNRLNPRVETIRRLLVAAGKSWGWIDQWLESIAEKPKKSKK
jgi:transcriptional regulator with XRE-family HTH domain